MQRRGKTCIWQKQRMLLNQKSEIPTQKKPTEKMKVLKNQLKKCKLEVRRVFCNTRKNTTRPKLRKHAPKIQPQMKHTNTTTAPKNNSAPRDDDTRLLPPYPDRREAPPAPCKAADQRWPMETTNALVRTRQMQPCSINRNPNPEILKAGNEIAVRGRRNDA